MQVDMAILSILAVVIVFVIGAFKQNPLHLGILGMFVAFVIGKAAGIADTTIMGFFPTSQCQIDALCPVLCGRHSGINRNQQLGRYGHSGRNRRISGSRLWC